MVRRESSTAGPANLRERVSDTRGYSPRILKYMRAMAAAGRSRARQPPRFDRCSLSF
jgi:hypothetical protein